MKESVLNDRDARGEDISGAGGETRTPDIQIRSLSE